MPTPPVIAVHAGAGSVSLDPAQREEARVAMIAALERGRAALRDGGAALDAVQAAVAYMEDEVELFNAGRGAVLCEDGTAQLSAAVMRGDDRGAGAVALLTRTRSPVAAARAVMEHGPYVLIAGSAADQFAAAHELEQRPPDYFVTEHQRARLVDRGSDFIPGTVGAVCLDPQGTLAAATSTGGRRGQLPGRIGDTPTIGAGTWADDHVAVSCTGDGESFVRAAAAHGLAMRVAGGAVTLADAADQALAEVRQCDGTGGLICVDAAGGGCACVHQRGDEPGDVAPGRRAPGLGLSRRPGFASSGRSGPGACAAHELSHRVLDERVQLIGGDDSGSEQRRDPLDRRQVYEPDPLRVARGQRALTLASDNDVENRVKGVPGGGLEGGGARAVLAREHQLQQSCVSVRERDVGTGERAQLSGEVVAGAV